MSPDYYFLISFIVAILIIHDRVKEMKNQTGLNDFNPNLILNYDNDEFNRMQTDEQFADKQYNFCQ